MPADGAAPLPTSATIVAGHVLEKLREVRDGSVHCVVTSPPYYGLRDYRTEPQVWGGNPHCAHEWGEEIIGTAGRNDSGESASSGAAFHGQAAGYGGEREVSQGSFCRCGAWRGNLGLEPTPELYIRHLVAVFREVRRVLRDDGTLWLNMGDSYCHDRLASPMRGDYSGDDGLYQRRTDYIGGAMPKRIGNGLKPKDLMMIPAQLALALRADGWFLRSEIVWAKKAPMPESATDRPTCAHEKVFLLSKNARYFYDAEAVKEPGEMKPQNRFTDGKGPKSDGYAAHRQPTGMTECFSRNLRNVWHLGPEPFPEAHFAVFPVLLAAPCIKAGTSEAGVCSACGAPRVRVVETQSEYNGERAARSVYTGSAYASAQSAPRGPKRNFSQPFSLGCGWRPSCSCNAEPVAATVLDPFLGSGTTAVTAIRLGRNAVGIELSADYARMATRRVRGEWSFLRQPVVTLSIEDEIRTFAR